MAHGKQVENMLTNRRCNNTSENTIKLKKHNSNTERNILVAECMTAIRKKIALWSIVCVATTF